MSRPRSIRRPAFVGAAALTAVAVGAAPAMAHHCLIPMYSLNGPTSANWFVVSVEMGAGFEGYTAPCDAAVDVGYAALRAEGLPVGVEIFEKMVIGDARASLRDDRDVHRGRRGRGLRPGLSPFSDRRGGAGAWASLRPSGSAGCCYTSRRPCCSSRRSVTS